MTKQVFNVNCHVWVKLTDYGKQMLKARHDKFYQEHELTPREYVLPKEDEGWYQFQLWDLMESLGPYMGMARKNVFDLGIVLDTDDFLKIRDGDVLPS